METVKRCIFCGKRGQAKLNGEFWLCREQKNVDAFVDFCSQSGGRYIC